jgi:hypothetical protein
MNIKADTYITNWYTELTVMQNKLRGSWSASELYRLSDSHLSTKFSANFLWIEGCRVVIAADPLRSFISVF